MKRGGPAGTSIPVGWELTDYVDERYPDRPVFGKRDRDGVLRVWTGKGWLRHSES